MVKSRDKGEKKDIRKPAKSLKERRKEKKEKESGHTW